MNQQARMSLDQAVVPSSTVPLRSQRKVLGSGCTEQRGMVLLMALVFLLILTVAGVSAMRLANVEEKMTSNFGERNLAFQSAEAALVEAERFLDESDFQQGNFYSEGCAATTCFYSKDATSGLPTCDDGLCFMGSFEPSKTCTVTAATTPNAEIFQSAALWDDSDQYMQATITAGGLIPPARILIEFRCFAVKNPMNPAADQMDPNNEYIPSYWEPLYRITVIGYGRNPNARVMLQSTYRRD